MNQQSRSDPVLPRAVALAWGVAANPQRGPKRELSIERIVEVAIEIADSEGLAAVSMSRVASTLGFTTMSLYRYVTSKDDLILLMQEAAGERPIPAEPGADNWRDGIRDWMLALADVYDEHPWIIDIPISGAPITPNSLAMVDWFLREVRSLPLSDGEKMGTLMLLTSYARAMAAQNRDIASATAAAADPADVSGASFYEALVELVTPERFPYLSPLLHSGGYVSEPGAEEEGDDFEFGRERILDGIAAHVAIVERQGNIERQGNVEQRGSTDAVAPAASSAAAQRETAPLPTLVSRDKNVREAAKARRDAEKSVREAEKKLREALKHERDVTKQAVEKAARAQ